MKKLIAILVLVFMTQSNPTPKAPMTHEQQWEVLSDWYDVDTSDMFRGGYDSSEDYQPGIIFKTNLKELSDNLQKYHSPILSR